MNLRFVGTTSMDDGCPTLYAADGDQFVVQGYKMDPLVAEYWAGPIDPGEQVVEVPAGLLDFATTSTGRALGTVVVTTHGTAVIKGVPRTCAAGQRREVAGTRTRDVCPGSLVPPSPGRGRSPE
jgi:hypothetical protein